MDRGVIAENQGHLDHPRTAKCHCQRVEVVIIRNSAPSRRTSVVQSYSPPLDSRTGEWTMKQLFAFLQVVCAKVYSSFVQHRLRTEFPCADNLVGRRLDHSSDDPRKSNGVPTVGIL
jgi:hypothetical protein